MFFAASAHRTGQQGLSPVFSLKSQNGAGKLYYLQSSDPGRQGTVLCLDNPIAGM